MYEPITKKEFIETLKNGENELLYSHMNLLDASCTKMMDLIYRGEWTIKEGRTPKRIQSNAIQFSDGSWLYFDSIRKCYKHNNVILSYGEEYDSFDEVYKYSIMAYIVK